MRINHIHLNSPDVDRSIDFYRTYFDLQEKKMPPDAPRFLEDEDGFLLAISSIEERVELPAWFHIGFAKLTAERVRQIHERMKRDGVRFAKDLLDREEEGVVTFHCYDPAGYRVEVSWIEDDFQ